MLGVPFEPVKSIARMRFNWRPPLIFSCDLPYIVDEARLCVFFIVQKPESAWVFFLGVGELVIALLFEVSKGEGGCSYELVISALLPVPALNFNLAIVGAGEPEGQNIDGLPLGVEVVHNDFGFEDLDECSIVPFSVESQQGIGLAEPSVRVQKLESRPPHDSMEVPFMHLVAADNEFTAAFA